MSEIHICRTCSRLISDQQFVNFNETPLKTNLPQMLKDCIPELQFKVVDPCLCIKCLSLLYLFHEFKQTCLETEKKIKNYVQSHRETEFVSLKDIFVEQIPIKKEVTETTTKDIKSEDVKPNLETLLTQDIKPLKVIETPAIDIKSETDTEFEDTATIDDNIEENKDIEEVVAEIKQEVVDLTECDEETVEETPKQPSKVVKVPPNSILPKNPGRNLYCVFFFWLHIYCIFRLFPLWFLWKFYSFK